MVRRRPIVPQGHGEVLTDPPYVQWAGMAERTVASIAAWDLEISGVPVSSFRAHAREHALREAEVFSAVLGLKSPAAEPRLLAVTGHQPELYHPGVWVKDFLLQRFMEDTGAAGLDLVVDSDSFDALAMTTPCMSPGVQRCQDYLAVAPPGGCYACTPVPPTEQIEDFCRSGSEMLATLPAPAIKRHFDGFCDALREAAGVADDLGGLVTIARRLYERPAGTSYLELPVTRLASTEAFRLYVLDLVCRAERVHSAYNAELAEFRSRNRTRSPLQPFPDLAREGERIEMPFWVLEDGNRQTLWARPGKHVALIAGGREIAQVDPCAASAVQLERSGIRLAPKAVSLTLYARMFLADIFLHGVGGARYDEVTDGLIRRLYGVEPPAFVTASMTMYLPLGGHGVSDEEIAAAKRRANRLRHNADQMLGELDFDSDEERSAAEALSREKASLVEQIERPGADKKALGSRIKETNGRLTELLEPLVEAADREVETLISQKEVADVLTDRTYPFCLWSPLEVQDKVR